MFASFKKRLIFFLAIMGPGLITANVDNDANGIATYSTAGSQFGYSMLWILLVVCLFQVVVQEMCARMGCVTQKGLADLIRENFGVKATFFVMSILFLANMANTVGDFAGLAAGTELFGIPRWVSVPLGALFLGLLVVGSSYQRVEKIFIAACLIYVTYVISGVMARPNWTEIGQSVLHPTFPLKADFVSLAVAVVGTTIAPWMQFFQQSAIRDKGIRKEDYRYEYIDTIVGTIVMTVVGAFVVIACSATLFHAPGGPIKVDTADQAAQALAPLAGNYFRVLFGVGLINAALFSVSIIPLSTAYAICEAFGWESGIGLDVHEAPAFFGIYGLMLVGGAALLMIPGLPLFRIMVFSQAINGALLPVILVCILLLINKKSVMGTWVNSRGYNIVAWACTMTVVVVTVIMVVLTVKSMLE